MRIWNLSLLPILVAFQTQNIYPTCSRMGYALLYRWFSGPWRAGPSPSRRIYQRAVAHKQQGGAEGEKQARIILGGTMKDFVAKPRGTVIKKASMHTMHATPSKRGIAYLLK